MFIYSGFLISFMARNVKIPIRNNLLPRTLAGIMKWRIGAQDKQDLPRFFNDLESGRVTGNQLKPGTVCFYAVSLRIGLEHLNKQTASLELADIDRLCDDLRQDVLKRRLSRKAERGSIREYTEPYTERGKIKVKNALILYLEWKLKDKAAPFTSLLKIRPRLKQQTPDYLSEAEVDKLFKGCKTNEERFVIAVLFDSGARAEEFHNIRHEDIALPRSDGNFVKLTLKEEYSKTKGRVISLYWHHSLEVIQEYLNDRLRDGMLPADPVFSAGYSRTRKFLYRLGKRVLGRPVHYHLFRHSSATHYASKLNRQQLCIRYGWRFSSPMPDVYISRAGVDDKELDKKFESTEIGELKQKLDKQASQQNMFTEWKQDLERQLASRKAMDPIMNAVMANPDILKAVAEEVSRLGLAEELKSRSSQAS